MLRGRNENLFWLFEVKWVGREINDVIYHFASWGMRE